MSKLFLATLLFLTALQATAERYVNPYPKLPPERRLEDIRAGEIERMGSVLPDSWHQHKPPPPRSEICKEDPLNCINEKINTTPSESYRRSTMGRDTRGRLDQPLPYAQYLQRYMNRGYAAGPGKCARGVRFILEAAGFIPTPNNHSSYDEGREYYAFLTQFGFKHDWSSCRSPGAIRIYGGAIYPDRVQRNRTAGDANGHVEIVTLEGKYMSFTLSNGPIGERTGEMRRPLIACLYKKPGTYEALMRSRGFQ